jgi:hypothetical protein
MEYLEQLKEAAKGYPIEVLTAPTKERIREVLSSARVFWQLTGVEVREMKHSNVRSCPLCVTARAK